VQAIVLFGSKVHNPVYAGLTVPAAIKDHDLTSGREPLNVSLTKQLCLLAFTGRRKRRDTKHPWIDSFGNRPNSSALARGIAAFKNDNDTKPSRYTQSCRWHSLIWSLRNSLSYFRRFNLCASVLAILTFITVILGEISS
jgi:hypothetical protein